MGKLKAEYIWMDGNKPTATLRSKTKIVDGPVKSLDDVPMWGFDGSSTMQADGHDSDRLLKPVCYVSDPVRKGDNILVMNEVLLPDGSVHETNTRAHLVEIQKKFKAEEAWFGIEQEYTFTFPTPILPTVWLPNGPAIYDHRYSMIRRGNDQAVV